MVDDWHYGRWQLSDDVRDNEEIFVGTALPSAFSGIGQTEDDGDWDDDWDDEEAAEWDDAVDAGIG